MSEENVEIVRQAYEASARRDAELALAHYDPEVEWDISRSPQQNVLGKPQIFHGHDGLRRFFRTWYEAWEHIEPDLEGLIDAGEHVISIETTVGRGRASGAEVELPHAAVWTIRNSKIIRVVWFGTRTEALEAAGLPE